MLAAGLVQHLDISSDASDAPLLRMQQITKRFPGVIALDGVDFDVKRGEVHVLFGENGAGKSTLINVIAGTYSPDAGSIEFNGTTVTHFTPRQSRLAGISPVFQEFSLAPDLTVEENLFLGREAAGFGVLHRKEMHERGRAVLARLGFDVDPKARVADLSRAAQQMTEVAKALMQDLQLLILDEPTSSLTEKETDKLFELIARLKTDRVGIIYVSHRMGEIRRIADRITVMRDGREIATVRASECNDVQLVEMMIGRKIDAFFPEIQRRSAQALVEGRGVTTGDGRLQNVDFHINAGEIVGVAGLVGCGKSELARAIFGLEVLSSGKISVAGEPVARPRPAAMLKKGVCYFPSDRVVEGLALSRLVRENITMTAISLPTLSSWSIIHGARERRHSRHIAGRLQVRPLNVEVPVHQLSGGNRQKVVLARGLSREFGVFLFDEPTVGIDVGSKTEIYEFMKSLVEQGAAVLLVSSELPEILKLSHRAYVMRGGYIVNELAGDKITESALLSSFFGSEP